MVRWAMIILFGFLVRRFLNLNMSSSVCPKGDFTESDLKLEYTEYTSEFVHVTAQKIKFSI